MRDVDLEAFAHSDIPFEQIVEAVAPTRSQAHTPLFQVMFSFEHRVSGPVTLPDLRVTPMSFETGIAQFDLALTLGESDDGLAGTLRYATDLFDESTASAIAQRYVAVLAAVVADPSLRVDSVELLSATERTLLVPVQGPPARAVVSWDGLVAAAVEANPAGVAVVVGGALSHLSRGRCGGGTAGGGVGRPGCGPGGVGGGGAAARSGQCGRDLGGRQDRGRVRAGGPDVSARADHPHAHRLRRHPWGHQQRDDSADTGMDWVLLDEIDTTTPHHRSPRCRYTASSGVCHLHLGSTGRPKGVVVTNAGLANLAAERRTRYAIDEHTRFLHHTSISFDMAVGEQVSALSGAGTLVIAPTGLLGAELSEFLLRERCRMR